MSFYEGFFVYFVFILCYIPFVFLFWVLYNRTDLLASPQQKNTIFSPISSFQTIKPDQSQKISN